MDMIDSSRQVPERLSVILHGDHYATTLIHGYSGVYDRHQFTYYEFRTVLTPLRGCVIYVITETENMKRKLINLAISVSFPLYFRLSAHLCRFW